MSKYCTLQSIEFGHKFITPFDPDTDTPESVVKMTDGKVAYKFLEIYDTIPQAQIAIYGRSYEFKEKVSRCEHTR